MLPRAIQPDHRTGKCLDRRCDASRAVSARRKLRLCWRSHCWSGGVPLLLEVCRQDVLRLETEVHLLLRATHQVVLQRKFNRAFDCLRR